MNSLPLWNKGKSIDVKECPHATWKLIRDGWYAQCGLCESIAPLMPLWFVRVVYVVPSGERLDKVLAELVADGESETKAAK